MDNISIMFSSVSSTVLTISRFEDNWGVVATNLSCEGTYNFRSKRYLDWLFQGITLTIASISLFFTTTNTEIKRISRDTVDSEAITIEVLTESDADNDRFSATFSENQKRIKRHRLQRAVEDTVILHMKEKEDTMATGDMMIEDTMTDYIQVEDTIVIADIMMLPIEG
ncbi:2648_t:CDS:2 [Entrophospora sp. SA101]|nr:2648_t:CDS:2 [Entrophospora sp. SA101]